MASNNELRNQRDEALLLGQAVESELASLRTRLSVVEAERDGLRRMCLDVAGESSIQKVELEVAREAFDSIIGSRFDPDAVTRIARTQIDRINALTTKTDGN